ncbi:MFS transporter [uncultured Amnibacterium sp.]|uniref:MFS transporter n=1 Tax=uncultured Amnibacterium sp. TaxID=1631851 RepID=UPI0035CA1BE9
MTTAATGVGREPVTSLIPARLDRLPWTRFHWSVVVGLGVSWVLDGLEIELASAGGFSQEFHLNPFQTGAVASVYLAGQVVGALVFGRLADRLGRKRFFIITLLIYLIGSGIGGLAPAYWFLLVFRFVAGLGIGGEYTAINSAIDEIIPSHYRGRVDIIINGTYWGGAALGAVANIFLLRPDLVGVNLGWRIGFLVGPVLGLVIIYLRRHIPESPRWQLTHGHAEEAEANIDRIEAEVRAEHGELDDVPQSKAIRVTPTSSISFLVIARIFFRKYPDRTLVAFVMMVTQAFLYNAIFFSYAKVLEVFFGVSVSNTQVLFLAFAVGNLAGPLVLGHLFDTLGRRRMIFLTYAGSGVILAVSAALFQAGLLNAITQMLIWSLAFFFASAGASSAYLTVSETFPLELRGQAISYFFSIAQVAGALAPIFFGALIGTSAHPPVGPLAVGYYIGAGAMIVGGVVALIFAQNAERKSLEDVSEALSLAA